ncbi:MAG: hypothetical protein HY843_04155, partial [Bdellovibrio sp.]|nr:hypothetical protein [Bdellovibrio sp.]
SALRQIDDYASASLDVDVVSSLISGVKRVCSENHISLGMHDDDDESDDTFSREDGRRLDKVKREIKTLTDEIAVLEQKKKHNNSTSSKKRSAYVALKNALRQLKADLNASPPAISAAKDRINDIVSDNLGDNIDGAIKNLISVGFDSLETVIAALPVPPAPAPAVPEIIRKVTSIISKVDAKLRELPEDSSDEDESNEDSPAIKKKKEKLEELKEEKAALEEKQKNSKEKGRDRKKYLSSCLAAIHSAEATAGSVKSKLKRMSHSGKADL